MSSQSELRINSTGGGNGGAEKRSNGKRVGLTTGIAEAPRFSCSLGGAYSCTLATFGAVPIVHSGPGCILAQNFGQNFAGGLNGAGQLGNTSTPCSCLVDEHVVFGGEAKLRALVDTTRQLVKGELFVVISGCVPALIGDDVAGVVRDFKNDGAPIVIVNTAGFKGNSYHGYHSFIEAIIDQLLTPKPVEKGLVNLFGVVPYQHIFWKGHLQVLKSLLASIGLRANMLFTETDGLAAWSEVPAAELNLVFSPWCGVPSVERLEEKFGTPHLDFPSVPIGPKDTTAFLRAVGERLGVDSKLVEAVIATEELRTYRFTEYVADMAMIALPHAYAGIVADTSTAIGLTRYASNELGWLPEVVVITDDPPPNVRDSIAKHLTEGLESAVKPRVVFEVDSHKIRLLLREHTVQILLASSLEKYIAGDELQAMQVSVAFPTYDRLIVDRTYAGYRGGIALMEDVASKYGGPL
ncbi:MAG TPA: nitrogenase component 1 [Polyangiaceae bacterium]|nr:nitrogenase component 1 [Polyangiaceae bacterium]